MKTIGSILAAMMLPLTAAEEVITAAIVEGKLAEQVHRELSRMNRANGFSGAVIVARDGEVLLDVGYGYADRQKEVPFTTETVAQIGSLTKQFTAMAIIDLALAGKVAFDAPVSSYLPEAAAPARSATIDQFLTHRSGMAEYCGPDFQRVPRAELLADCMARPLRFEPGTDSAYSNPGYSVLAAVVERVSGSELGDYLREAIFAPNRLRSIGYRPPSDAVLARGYLDGVDQGVISERIAALDGDFWALKGNGGMQASSRDMFGWYEALAGRRALSEAHIEAAITPRAESGRSNWAAYGWNIGKDEEGRIDRVSHAGSDGVFFSYFWWNPAADLFYYLVGNSGEEIVLDAVRAVRRTILEFLREEP